MANWQFANGGLAQGDVGSAPTYKDVTFDFMGQKYFKPGEYDPALAMTLNAGNQGRWLTGLDAFLQHGSDDTTDPLSSASATGYRTQDLKDLATQFGIDPNSENLQQQLADRTKAYSAIGGLSGGWNQNTGDNRQANMTLYESRDGQLVPIQTSAYHAPTEGSWLSEHKGILAPLAVVTGGLAYGALAGAGAGAAGGAGAGAAGAGAGGAGITGTAGASGMAAYGAGAAPGMFATAGTGSLGAGLGGLGGFWAPGMLAGSTAYGGLGAGGAGFGAGAGNSGLMNWYNNLPKYQQSALRGAGQNFVTSGGDPRAALRGGITGGLSGGVSDALGGGFWGNLGGKLVGGLGGGLASSLLGGGGGAARGGSSGGGGAGGGGGMSGNAVGGSGSGSSAGGGGISGLAGGSGNLGYAAQQQRDFLARSYAPVAAEEARRRLAERLQDENGDDFNL